MMSSKKWEVHAPYFEAGSGYYGETLGKFNEGVVKLSQDLLLSFVGKIKCLPTIFLLDDLQYFSLDDLGSVSVFALYALAL